MEATLEPHLSTKTTAEIVDAMLKENTGRGITDSGDYYGRNWEMNQGKDFSKEPKTWARFDVTGGGDGNPGRLEICATLSIYHWMVHALEYDAEMQEELLKFSEARNDLWWGAAVEKFADALFIRDAHEARPLEWYTYNLPDRSDLSQDIVLTELFGHYQFEPSHVIIRVHGGCDARSGFTAPTCFRVRHGENFSESMKLSGFAAGSQEWRLEGMTLSPYESNDCRETLKDLPAYRWEGLPALLADTVQDARETQSAIDSAEQIKDRLGLTQLTDGQVEAARQVVDAQVKRMEEELRNACVIALAKRHEWFVICEKGQAWLFSDDATEFAEGDAIVAFSDVV